MRFGIATLGALVFAAPTVAVAAQATAPQCAQHKQLEGYLLNRYHESPVALGTVNDSRYMQLFVSAAGTWTILVTGTDGEACIVAAGENLEKTPITPKPEPAA